MQEAEGDQQHAMSELQQQIQESTQAIEQQDAEGARAALDEARTKLQEIRTAASEEAGQQGAQQAQTGGQQDQQQAQTGAQEDGEQAQTGGEQDRMQGGQQQGQDMQQAMYEVRQQLQQVREAVEQQNFEQAEQALQRAEQALDEAQMAAQQGGGQQGDISVSVVPADQQDRSEQEAAATQETTRERLSAEETNRLLGMGEREMGEAAETLTLTPLDLEDRDVVTMDGEEVGEVAEVVSSGGTFYAVIEHGGFLGIGEDRVAIPLERIGMRGEEVILLGLTPEQLEAMPEYDFEADEDVANEQSIEIGRYE
jgi:hypothetical protein